MLMKIISNNLLLLKKNESGIKLISNEKTNISNKNTEVPQKQEQSMLYRFQHFDWIGSILFLEGGLLFLAALCNTANSSMPTVVMIIFFIVGGVSLIVVCILELWIIKNPAIHFDIFKIRNFSIANFGGIIASYSRSIVLFATIFYFQGVMHKTPFMAGVMTIPFGGGLLLFGFWAGRLSDKYGPRAMQLIGPFVAGAASLGLSFINGSTNYGAIAVSLFTVGAGQGIFNSPNSASAMVSVPRTKRGAASGWRMMMLFLAQTLAIISLFGIIKTKIPLDQLIDIFLYGGKGVSNASNSFMTAIKINYYIAAGTAWFVCVMNIFLLYLWDKKVEKKKKNF
jgi:hypothetical protein